jgi:lysophospholipase
MQPAAENFQPIFFEAAGVRLRAARFAGDPAVGGRGVCVLLNGGTEFIEKYFEVIDELRARGFAVATMDWRGQGGSARLLTDDSRKGYVKDFTQYDADLMAFLAQIVAPMGADKPVALAHSMGAHNLLRYLVKNPDSFARCVLSAPMMAIAFRSIPAWLVRFITLLENKRGNANGWVWGVEARDPHAVNFATQWVTSDQARFDRTQAFLRAYPELRLSGPTWSWLAAAMRSMNLLNQQAEKITTPLLVIGAGADRIVTTSQTKAFAARLPNASYVQIAGAGHEMLMERDVFRVQWWAAFDDFMMR